MIKLLLRQSTLIHRLQMFRDRFSEVSLYSMSGFDEVTTTSKFELPLPPPSLTYTTISRRLGLHILNPTIQLMYIFWVCVIKLTMRWWQVCKYFNLMRLARQPTFYGNSSDLLTHFVFCRDVFICLSLFDGLAYEFHLKKLHVLVPNQALL